MKINSCYIENFGGLSNCSFDFSEQLTTICQANGTGKTTLAAFIKAMFYGYPHNTKRKIEENERLKFSPWQGGQFGGFLEFEINDNKYRIERFFGKKATDDTKKIIDLRTNKETNCFIDPLGEELFSINSEAFERTIFMPQNKLETGENDSLTAKLGNLIDDTEDVNNFEKAIERLKVRSSFYASLRGEKGEIFDLKRAEVENKIKINESQENEKALQIIVANLEQNKAELLTTSKQVEAVRSEISKASSVEADIAQQKMVSEMKAEIESTNLELLKLERFKNVSLSETQVENCRQKIKQLATTKETIAANRTCPDEEVALLEKAFENGVPTDEEIAEIGKKIKKANDINAEKQQLLQTANLVVKNGNKRLILVSCIFAVCLIVVGGICSIFVNLGLGIGMLAAGFVGLIICGFIHLNAKIGGGATTAQITLARQRLDEANLETEQIKACTNAFFAEYDCLADSDIAALEKLKLNKQRFTQAMISENKRIEILNLAEQKQKQLENEISAFFDVFNQPIDADFSTTLANLKSQFKDFSILTEKMAVLKKRYENLPKAKEVQLSGQTLENAKPLELLKTEEKGLLEKINQLNALIAKQNQQVQKIESEQEQIVELEENAILLAEKLETATKNKFILDNAMQLLSSAKDDLSGKYLTKMINSFKEYSEDIIENVGQIKIDTQFNLLLERMGQQRKVQYFSEGYKNMFNICLRLALADSLYESDDKPPLILDDPFVNLDESHLQNAKKALNHLASGRQIIYLTCHDSRKI